MWIHSFIRFNSLSLSLSSYCYCYCLCFCVSEFYFCNAKMIISNDILLMHLTVSSKNSEIAALSVLRSLIEMFTCSYHQVKQALVLLFTSVPNAHKIQKERNNEIKRKQRVTLRISFFHLFKQILGWVWSVYLYLCIFIFIYWFIITPNSLPSAIIKKFVQLIFHPSSFICLNLL